MKKIVFSSGIRGAIPYAPEEPARVIALAPGLNGTVWSGPITPTGRYTSITRHQAICCSCKTQQPSMMPAGRSGL